MEENSEFWMIHVERTEVKDQAKFSSDIKLDKKLAYKLEEEGFEWKKIPVSDIFPLSQIPYNDFVPAGSKSQK